MKLGSDGELRADSYVVAAGRRDEAGEPLNVPLVPASNFVLGGERGYARGDGTPTWEALEALVGGLEGGEAVAFSSGMAAIAAVLEPLPIGARIVLPDACYHGVAALAASGDQSGRWSVSRLGVGDTAGWIDAGRYADLLWLESPSNPLLEVADLAAICAAARKPKSMLAVDNTFATPLNQRPLELGADVSVQSVTKFIGGHSDLLAGVATARSPDVLATLQQQRLLKGATPGTLEAYLAVRGARTMAIRLQRAQTNALELAERLEAHAAVAVVRYPGLASHPSHTIARDQLGGFGSIISFDVAGAAAADAVCASLDLIHHATSLGAVESTVERRGAVSGQSHLPPGLLRLSVGIENVEDLWADLAQALDKAHS